MQPTSPDIAERGRPAIRVFTTKQGLPQNTIQTMARDTRGYLWVGTQDGAARYNGREWITVKMPNRKKSNFVGAVLASADGSMWFGTNGGGVCQLAHGKWTVHDVESGALPDDQVRALLETHNRAGEPVLWVGTRGGLARLANGRWQSFGVESGLPDPVVRSLLATTAPDGTRSLWVGTRNGLACVAGNVWATYDASDGLPPGAITCLLQTTGDDGAPVLWAGTESHGLGRFERGRWTAVDSASGLPDNGVRSLLETRDRDGERTLWVGTEGGLGRLSGGRWSVLDARTGLPHNVVMSLRAAGSEDPTRAVWLGTLGGGLARMELGRWLTVDTTAGLPARSVWSLLETRDRAMWFGTMDAGVARWERGEWTVFDAATGLPDNFVLCMLETGGDRDRAVWVGTLGGGLARYQGGAWTVVDSTSGLPHDSVLCLLESAGGVLWAGTNGGGLARREHGVWTTFDTTSGLPNNVVSSLLETVSPAGARSVWAGTNGGGLARYRDGAWTIVDSHSGLPNDLVMGLAEVRLAGDRRELWVGTQGAGVARMDLDASEPRWRGISTTTPISSDVVYQIRQDGAGRIYLFTNRGVDRLTPRAPSTEDWAEFDVYTFTAEDGLPSGECNSTAALVDSTGRVWAGTGEGAAMLDPATEIEDRTTKPLGIERAHVGGRDRDIERRESLAHDENDLTLEFALMSYFREHDTRYRTQLVGFDRRPSEWTTDWKRSYTNLPEGEFTFHVWGRDYAGNVSGPVLLPFRVRPAPWRTWWAYTLYAGTATGFGYAAIRYRLEALRRRNVELQHAIDERTAQLAEKVDELQVSERRALDANRAKSVFLSSMSHELRTPLNAILGFVQVMQHKAAREADDRESLDIIMRSGEHLLGLINDVLSISKIEAGRLTLNPQPFDLLLLLKGIEEMIRVRAEGKGIALDVEVEPGVPQFVTGDEGKLRQVLINLLGNAVKFTERGGVRLDVERRDGRARFVVEDTGFGIAEEEIGKLFQPFQQTASGQQTTEGTGLGLAISRTFVQLMGGDIAVRSTLGGGTTFAFEVDLPAAAGASMRAAARRAVGLELGEPLYRLVVVDDAPANRQLLRKILEPVGFQVREAATGVEAVDLWERWHPHLIWMDSRLPGLSGVEATRAIRSRETAAEPSTKIIALTASAFEHDRAEFLDAGCDGFVAKPYREAELFEALETHLGARFRYDEPVAVAHVEEKREVTAERLSTLSRERIGELHEAALQGDLEAAYAVVDRVREDDDALADDLHALVRGYRFDELLDAIEATDLHG